MFSVCLGCAPLIGPALSRKTLHAGTKNSTLVRLSSCPSDMTITWTKALPTMMYAQRTYNTLYTFAYNRASHGGSYHLVGGKLYDISHANIHSCWSNVGFCTPFIGNTPGLA